MVNEATERDYGRRKNNNKAPSFQGYKMAMAFGGDPTPPLIFNGALVKKKLHFFLVAQVALSVSRSQSSPIGVPH
jgi:hypothetical protein